MVAAWEYCWLPNESEMGWRVLGPKKSEVSSCFMGWVPLAAGIDDVKAVDEPGSCCNEEDGIPTPATAECESASRLSKNPPEGTTSDFGRDWLACDCSWAFSSCHLCQALAMSTLDPCI
eukprot:jgi/Ulvmu1/9387/UM051_0014.1